MRREKKKKKNQEYSAGREPGETVQARDTLRHRDGEHGVPAFLAIVGPVARCRTVVDRFGARVRESSGGVGVDVALLLFVSDGATRAKKKQGRRY